MPRPTSRNSDRCVRASDSGSSRCRCQQASRSVALVSESDHLRELYRRIHAVVRKIPRGAVATYGQVAELAGIPGGARVAGAAMKTSKPADKLPWQRVIGKAGRFRGRIAIHDPVGAAVQRKLLEDEGITVGDTGLVPLDVYGWLPGPNRRPAKKPQRSRR